MCGSNVTSSPTGCRKNKEGRWVGRAFRGCRFAPRPGYERSARRAGEGRSARRAGELATMREAMATKRGGLDQFFSPTGCDVRSRGVK